MATTTEKPAERKSPSELRAMKAEREAAEKAKAAESAKPTTNGRAKPDAAHRALDIAPQDVHAGDPGEHEAPVSASGAQLSFAMAGKKPTTAGLRLIGGKLDVDQQFSKGQKIVLRIEAEIRAVEFVDQVDGATGQVVGSERRHKASIVGVAVL